MLYIGLYNILCELTALPVAEQSDQRWFLSIICLTLRWLDNDLCETKQKKLSFCENKCNDDKNVSDKRNESTHSTTPERSQRRSVRIANEPSNVRNRFCANGSYIYIYISYRLCDANKK
jgi:hypothetical protein